ncbi:hypothetical protein ACWD25_02300 [Streptomyces sp. NPDC002920]
MPEPLDDEYLKQTQRIIIRVPKGPWKVEPNDYGLPDQVGPIAYVQTWADKDLIPVIEFIAFAREALPRYVGEVARLKDHIRRLERAQGGASNGA